MKKSTKRISKSIKKRITLQEGEESKKGEKEKRNLFDKTDPSEQGDPVRVPKNGQN